MPKRFKTKSESEVDELAKRRTGKSTDRQAEWSVRIFEVSFNRLFLNVNKQTAQWNANARGAIHTHDL